jgi:hypothetical protein
MSAPYYGITIISHDVASEIRVNDVPVLRLPGSHVETSFDVNPFMQAGHNTLSIHVRPSAGAAIFGPQASCSAELVVKPDRKSEDATPLAMLAFEVGATPNQFTSRPGSRAELAGSGAPIVQAGPASASVAFDHAAPFGPWSWAQATELNATEALRAEVLATYRHIHQLLVARDIATLLRACDGQARDFQAAYGLPDLASAQRMLGISETLSDPNISIEDFPPEILSLELLGGRRLVQLVDARGKSPLRLRMGEDSAMVGRFNVVLCRTGSTWMIAR